MILFSQPRNSKNGFHFSGVSLEQKYSLIQFLNNSILNPEFQFAKPLVLLQLGVNRLDFTNQTINFCLHISSLGG